MKTIRFKDYLIDYLEYNNITQKDFANRIGITPKHLIDILSGERDLSASLIDNISIVTNIPIDYIYRMESNYKFEIKIKNYLKSQQLSETQYLNKYNYNYLIKTNFIDFVDCGNKLDMIKDILKFLRVSSPEKVTEIDKTAYYKSKNDKPELLLLWLEKCYRETLKQTVKPYLKENINYLVNYILNQATNERFNEKKLIKEFNEYGIYLVIQDDIPGSKIRGAFKVHKDIPAIYLTHKHQRIADIYFTLLHELAHCKTDFNKAKSTSLISYENNMDQAEEKADNTAYNWMVENKYYQTICCDANYNIKNETTYPKSFVIYRLAKDKKIPYNSKEYQHYNFLLKETDPTENL